PPSRARARGARARRARGKGPLRVAMDVPGFSKVQVDALLEDEEDERQRAVGASRALYAKAQDAFAAKGSTVEVLQLFEQAEAAMAGHMGAGLAGLAPEEPRPAARLRGAAGAGSRPGIAWTCAFFLGENHRGPSSTNEENKTRTK
ncbi:unnamed protein product, partial [Prorocentrum cordatum]